MADLSVSAIIPVKDDERVFACVDAVLACRHEAADLQIIVVDNASEPEFRKQLERLVPAALVLDEPRSGAYAARNRALEAATGDVLAFTDADCIVRPGWIAAALATINAGASIAQGFSGSLSDDFASRLVQRRYEAAFRHLRPGDAVLADTRNLAARRAVFECLRFDDRFHRSGDTRLGLLAERRGFRVAYTPAMRADHAHEPDLALFAAKQIAHGWGARRMVMDEPGLSWHGGHPLMVNRSLRLARLLPRPALIVIARALARSSIGATRAIERVGPRLPFAVALGAFTLAEKAALFAGHLLGATGRETEPLPSEWLGRAVVRE